MAKVINLKHDTNIREVFEGEGRKIEDAQKERLPTLEQISIQADSVREAFESYQETTLAHDKDATFHYGETTEQEKDTTLQIVEEAIDEVSSEPDQTVETGTLGTYIKVMIQRAWSEMTQARATLKEMVSLRTDYMRLAVHPSTDNLDERIQLLEHGQEHAEEMSKSVASLGLFGARALVAMEMFHRTHPSISQPMLADLAEEYQIWANENLQISKTGDYDFLALYRQILSTFTGNVAYAELADALKEKRAALEALRDGETQTEIESDEDPFEELDDVNLELEIDQNSDEEQAKQTFTKAA